MPSADDQPLGFFRGRWDALDAARGSAVVAMIGYHLGWDLSFLRLIVPDVGGDPVWQWFARLIAGSFLALVGFGLVLAHGKAFRPRAFLRRLALIAGAALAVTAGTLLAFPDRYIFFGILHSIALSSVLALPFLRAPPWIVAIAAAAALAAPWLAASPRFDAPLLAFLGLGTRVPPTNDYVPLFPWFGVVLAGVLLGRLALGRWAPAPEARWRARGWVPRAVVWAGRHSLPIYLTHQVVLLGTLTLLVQLVGQNPAAQSADFLRECRATCLAAGRDGAACRAACGCVAERLKREGLWADAIANRLGPGDQARLPGFARQCFGEAAARLPLRQP